MKMSLFVLIFFFISMTAKSQETATGVIFGVNEILTKLGDLEQKVDGSTKQILNQLSQNLNSHLNDFKNIVGNQINEPLTNLNINIQNQGRLLRNTIDNINVFLGWQQDCIIKNADFFQASLVTAGLQLASNIRFVGKSNEPFVSSIIFDGKPIYLVPLEGGRATIKGFRLFEEFSPIVNIKDEKRITNLISNIEVGRAGNNNDVSILLTKEFMQSNVGKLINIEIIPRVKKFLIGGPKNLPSVFIPLKIPSITLFQYKIRTNINYKFETTEIFELSNDKWIFEEQNSACKEVKAVSGSHTWNICNECRIINIKQCCVEERHMGDGGNIQFNITARDVISYSGTVGRPSCICPLVGCKLITHAFYRPNVWPEVQKVGTNEESKSNTSNAFILDESQKTINIDIPVNPNKRKETNFSFDIIRISNSGNEQVIFTSPRFNSDDNGVTANTKIIDNGYRFDATLNNKTSQGNVQVNVVINAPPCGL